MKRFLLFTLLIVTFVITALSLYLEVGSAVNWQNKVGSHLDTAVKILGTNADPSRSILMARLQVSEALKEVDRAGWRKDPAVEEWYNKLSETRESYDSMVKANIDLSWPRSRYYIGPVLMSTAAPSMHMGLYPYDLRPLGILGYLFGTTAFIMMLICAIITRGWTKKVD